MEIADPPSPVAAVSHGVTLTFETLVFARDETPPVRLRPSEDTLVRVVDGIVRAVIRDEPRMLGIGDELVIPAGAPHRLASAGGEARIVSGYRPAARR
jgi:mannose-6-phosphate isomerase-like protein (cupin superfamily)